MSTSDQRLIEAGFPCHQVGAETQRERGASSALPPLYYLHVWWARRPLTPSRAAILASLMPADSDTNEFIQSLGIQIVVANVAGIRWELGDAKLRSRVLSEAQTSYLEVDSVIQRAITRENSDRESTHSQLNQLIDKDETLKQDPIVVSWLDECEPIPIPSIGQILPVEKKVGDPAWAKEKIAFAREKNIRFPGDAYNYPRAYTAPVAPTDQSHQKIILDPTAGGGSIPFEALRLGHRTIANELNPVASVILTATLKYPGLYGHELAKKIEEWGRKLVTSTEEQIFKYFALGQDLANVGQPKPAILSSLSEAEQRSLSTEDIADFLHCRQVTCPHCGGDAPLLNSLWLAKEGERAAVEIIPNPDKSVSFKPHEVTGSKTEKLDAGTVSNGVGQCVHCQQAIGGDEIKRQARGESEHGSWKDILYTVVAIRLEPKLNKNGQVQRYASGQRKGEIKTQKIRYFRAPNQQDLQALEDATNQLEGRRFDFEIKGLVPNESIPSGSKTSEPIRYGMNSWEEMFTPRQLLGHLTVMETLQDLKPQILAELGEDRGRAVVTYLQFAADKIVDYNSRQNRWIPQRGTISGTFSRHDFSLKWTFGEMVYAGPSSGFNWGLSQVLNAYEGIAELIAPRHDQGIEDRDIIQSQGSGANLPNVESGSVDAVVMDPPYYNNVQYSELSDFYYVWQKRTLGDLYPGWFDDTVTDKEDEAVANPARDGSQKSAHNRYEELMGGIFDEAKRVLKKDGIMTLMFTHKSQGAWETLTNSLIENGWDITGTYPVDSEFGSSTHQLEMAAAASTIFIACRPADRGNRAQSSWSFEVKQKLEQAVRDGLVEFEALKLNPVDRMIAAWGRALRVYSAHWPVQDRDDDVPPTQAMKEAARVVAEQEVSRLSNGLVDVTDLDAESRVAVIALGINGLGDFAYDDILQMTRSLNLRLNRADGNYRVSEDLVSYASNADGEKAAPFFMKGNKIRLLAPETRSLVRLENPQTLWDVLCGLITTYRDGGVVAARNYLQANERAESDALRGLLRVWAQECRDDALSREARMIDYEL